MGDRPAAFGQGTPTAIRVAALREVARDRVPETLPCPRLAVQNGRLAWASEGRRGHALRGSPSSVSAQSEGRRRIISSDAAPCQRAASVNSC
jgi:hypothetical protein